MSHETTRRVATACLVILQLSIAAAVAAQPESVPPDSMTPDSMTDDERLQEAVRLSELGRGFYDDGDFAEAAEAFDQAWQYHPDPVLGYNAARSYENAGEPERALSFYEATLELEFEDESLRQRCRDAITRLQNLLQRVENDRENQPATLHIDSDPPQALVLVDGENYGLTPVEDEIAPGSYAVHLELEGFNDYYDEVELEPGQVLSLRIDLIATTPPEGVVDEGGPNWLAVGLVGAGSLGSIALGIIAGVAAQNRYDEAQQPDVKRDPELFASTVDEGRGLQTASTFFYAVGLAGLVTTVVLYFVTDTSRDEPEQSPADAARIDVFVGPNSVEAGFRMVW